jgi:SAM-dependent methyltransferase
VDTWKFYAITHTDHVVLNPSSPARLDELIGLLALQPEPRVLDIGSGTAELLVRLAEAHGVDRSDGTGTSDVSGTGAGFRGVGVDTSPPFMARARESVAQRVPQAAIELLEMDGADYDAAAASFDLACCLGASWVFGGHRGTLRALSRAVRPGGKVLVGEPFWKAEPAAEYLAWAGMTRADFASHAENVAIGESEGLIPLLAWVSSDEDWDRYETLQWRAAARYVATNPDDPDVHDLLERVAHARHEYLAWGRDTLGWALYLFGRPADVQPA